MEVSRKSVFLTFYQYWHYRWAEPTNLCDLVRGAILGLIKGITLGFWWTMLGMAGTIATLFVLYSLLAPILNIFSVSVFQDALMIGTLLWFLGGGMLIAYFIHDWYTDFRYRRNRYRSPSPPSVIGEYLRARKQKICPLITIKD